MKVAKLWGFVCQHCNLHSGEAYKGEYPQEEQCPTCCNGEPMIPYEIPPVTPNKEVSK